MRVEGFCFADEAVFQDETSALQLLYVGYTFDQHLSGSPQKKSEPTCPAIFVLCRHRQLAALLFHLSGICPVSPPRRVCRLLEYANTPSRSNLVSRWKCE